VFQERDKETQEERKRRRARKRRRKGGWEGKRDGGDKEGRKLKK